MKLLGWGSCAVGFVIWLTFAILALPLSNEALPYAFGLQKPLMGKVLKVPVYSHEMVTSQNQTVAELELQFDNPDKNAKPANITGYIVVKGITASALDALGLLKAGAEIQCIKRGPDFEPISYETGDLVITSFLGAVVCCVAFTGIIFFQIWIGFKIPDPNAKWVRKYALAGNKFVYGGYPVRSIVFCLGYLFLLGLLTWYIHKLTVFPLEFTSALGMRVPDLLLLVLLVYTAAHFGTLGLRKP